MRKERGFTLIELLIVLAILAILIGIVALSVGNLRMVAMKRGMQSERETVETALNAYVTLQQPLINLADNTTEPKQINPNDAAFAEVGQYLKRATKYYYTWSDVGYPGQSVVVWNDGNEPTVCCTVDGCGEDTDGVDGDADTSIVIDDDGNYICTPD